MQFCMSESRRAARQLLALMSGLEEQWLRSDHAFDGVAEWDSGVELLLLPPALRMSRQPCKSSNPRANYARPPTEGGALVVLIK